MGMAESELCLDACLLAGLICDDPIRQFMKIEFNRF
jgi:hypothetical protein